MKAAQSRLSELTLVAVDGPTSVSLRLHPPEPVTIGRAAHHGLELNDPRVSRHHATLEYRAEEHVGAVDSLGACWMLADAGSRHGTWLNGTRLLHGRHLPIAAGDLIVIAPWTFRVVDESVPIAEPRSLASLTDIGAGDVTLTQLDVRSADRLAGNQLALLLACASAIHSAADERALASAVLDASISGTGFPNAALLRPLARDENVEVIDQRGPAFAGNETPQFSRSLIHQAAGGLPARLASRADAPMQQSIARLRIDEALCIPIMVGPAVAGFLYLDDRGDCGPARRMTDDAAAFAIGLARMVALAMANLRRLELERNLARVEAELHAAGEIQAVLMPRREGRCGPFSYTGQCRPGRYVGGDFFDVIPLPDGRLAVALGDVTGKSVAASVLMTVSHGFLHAALDHHGDPARAVTDLNRFVHPRCPADRFLTLWLGVFDADAGTVSFVDAGHGHATLVLPDGSLQRLGPRGSGPVGIMPDTQYQAETIALPRPGRALIVSDGFIEQRSAAADELTEPFADRSAFQFSMEGVRACLHAMPANGDEVAALFAAVDKHAGTSVLADDATAVVVRW